MRMTKLQKPFRDIQEKDLKNLNKKIHNEHAKAYKAIKGISKDFNDEYSGGALPGKARKSLNKKIASATTSVMVKTAFDEALTSTLNAIYSGYSYSYAKATSSYLSYKELTPAQLKIIKLDKIKGKTYIQRLDFHSKNLNKTVSSVIQNGIRNGRSNEDIAKMIAKRINVSEGHAMTIARTETARIGSIANERARKQAEDQGLVFTRVWRHYASISPREDHIEMDGVRVKSGEKFTLPNGETTYQPRVGLSAGETINCLCEAIEEFEGYESTERRDNAEIVKIGSYDHWKRNV